MTAHYHISDVRYIIWKMPISLIFRLVLNYTVQATGNKNQYTQREGDQINAILDNLGEIVNGEDQT